jgi:YfiH family protein
MLYIGGVLIMLAGVVGLILPVLPGWVLIFAGLSLIAPKLAERLKRRFFRQFFKSDLVYLEEWKKTGTQAGFTTKHFPLFLRDAGELSEPENRRKLLALMSESPVVRSHQLGPFKKFAVLNQVHGDRVAVLSADEHSTEYEKDEFYPLMGYDAAVTDIKGMTLLAFSADCLTLFFSAGSWVGVAHAGWRGSKSKVALKTLRLIAEKARCRPKHVRIIFGPAIGACHYEVGPEFKDIFRASSLLEKNGKLYFDLAKENRTQLREAGVATDNVTDHEICTLDENDNFYSFRKEKDAAGRIISFITKI